MEDMEQKNQPTATPSVTPPPEVLAAEASTAESAPVTTSKTKSATPWIAYVVAVVALLAIAAGVVYLMEKDGRLSTGIFMPANGISPNGTVATINGTKIKGAELSTSINQISTNASLQGVDINDPEVQKNIREQAVEMLVNTELLRQEAGKREIVITDEDVTARIAALVTEVGSQELLDERMTALGIDNDTLRRDVRSELLIQRLLDQVFDDSNITITDAEIQAVYDNAKSTEENLPELSEVRDQIETNLRGNKEQQILDSLLTDLREAATIEMPS
jgi:hypothetical protein